MNNNLQTLAQHRDALLLAEAIGWLHDYRKCSEAHLQAQALGSTTQALPRTELANRQPNLQAISLVLQPIQQTSRTVTNLLDSRTWNQDTLGQFLSRCHNTAHFDKQEPIAGEQTYPGAQISSAFGFEQPVATGLTNYLWNLPWNDLSQVTANRQSLQKKVGELFSQTVADSRRPINEVDLWSWGAFVGALYKAALAGALLTGTPPPAQNLQWRLLGIRVDGLEYISNVTRIPDLLARQQLLANALDAARDLLEVEYPLGSEVYRDQDGSVFIVPDIVNLLAIADNRGTTLQTRIVEIFTREMNGELLPAVTLEQNFWWGQDPNWSKSSPMTANDKLPDIKGLLGQQSVRQIDVKSVEDSWQHKKGLWEICPVCCLRPMGEGKDACATCLSRRASRVDTWLTTPQATIWMDELADANGRVALLVGRFGLDGWLSGDLVQTLLVKADSDPTKCVPKNPSPARLRRVWETCQRFWTETTAPILQNVSPGSRLIVIPDDKTNWQENLPYDGTVNGKAISLLWREQARHFVTISNLLWVAGALKELQEIIVSEPDTPARSRSFKVQGVMPAMGDMGQYNPTLTLLESPDQFMALIPAAEALEVAEQIRAAYAKQFGKVQNRLPLFLGLVFFPRKTPLAAVLEAGRRMANYEFTDDEWRIAEPPQNDGQTVTLELARQQQRITLSVPIVMGDNTTEDVWYPYFELAGTPAAHHKYRFEHAGAWWVHVKDLQAGETVRVTPARFAYLFLEHTAQRFRFDPARDAQYLDDLPRLMKMWQALTQCGLTNTGLRGIQALLETKAEMWGATSSELQALAETTLKQAGLFKRKDKNGNPLPDIVTPDDVTTGRFTRCLDLYLHILKQSLKEA